MVRHRLSPRGRWLVALALALGIGLCMLTTNFVARNLGIQAQAGHPIEKTDAALISVEAHIDRQLAKRQVASAGQPGGPTISGDNNDPAGSLAKENKPADSPSDVASTTSSLEIMDQNGRYDKPPYDNGQGEFMVGKFRQWAKKWTPYLRTPDIMLPLEAKTTVTPGSNPGKYGFKVRKQIKSTPVQLKPAMQWLAQNDRSLAEIQGAMNSYEVGIWEHDYETQTPTFVPDRGIVQGNVPVCRRNTLALVR